MGNEALVQAVIRLFVIGATAFVAAVGANLTILKDAIDDPIFAALIESVGAAVLSAILKFLGGATQPMPVSRGRAAEGEVKRPNPFAV